MQKPSRVQHCHRLSCSNSINAAEIVAHKLGFGAAEHRARRIKACLMTSSSKVPYLNSPRTGTTSCGRASSPTPQPSHTPVTPPLVIFRPLRKAFPSYPPRPRAPSHLHSASRASNANRPHEPLFPPHTAKGSFPGTWFGKARAELRTGGW